MGFRDLFRRRQPDIRSELRIEFLGEQDGPPERALKAALVEDLARVARTVRAYLARVGYQPASETAVALCLAGLPQDDPALVRLISERFAATFGTRVALDIIFVSPEQEADLRRVCVPFYPRAV